MPSIQQLRYEALAQAVEQATQPPPLLTLWKIAASPLDVRVHCNDGTNVEFRLHEVMLDGEEIWGREGSGGTVILPLAKVEALWHHRRRSGRALVVWLATMLSCAAGGNAIGAMAPSLGAGAGLLGGALLGALVGIGTLLLVDKWEGLYQWVLLMTALPPNKRLKLTARVDYGMNRSSARRSLGAIR